MSIKTKVRAFRLGKGIEKGTDLAKLVKIPISDIYRFERQDLRLSQKQLQKLADVLGVEVSDIADENGFALPL